MAVYTKINKKDISIINNNFNIEKILSFHGIKKGIENTNYLLKSKNKKYILTIFEKRVSEKEIPFFMELMDILNSFKISCPKPLKTKNKNYLIKLKKKSACVVSFLEGKDKKLLKTNDCFAIGKSIARMHIITKKIKIQHTLHEAKSAWRNFTIRVKNRDKVFDRLNSINPLVKLSYIPPNHMDKCYKNLKYNYDLRITEKTSSEIINLPCHQYMTPNNIKDLSKNVLRLIK